MGAALASFGPRHFYTVFAVGRKHPVESSQVYSWLGRQRCQLGDEIERFEDDVRGSIAVAFIKFILNEDIGSRPMLIIAIMLVLVGGQTFSTGLLSELSTRTYLASKGSRSYIVRNKEDDEPEQDDTS